MFAGGKNHFDKNFIQLVGDNEKPVNHFTLVPSALMPRFYRKKNIRNKWRSPKKLSAQAIRKFMEEMRAEIATLQTQQDDLSRRSSHRRLISDRINAEIRPLQERMLAILDNPAARKNALHAFFSDSPYTDEALVQLRPLQNFITSRLAIIPEDVDTALHTAEHKISELTRAVAEYEAALVPHLKREERLKEAQEKKQFQKQRIAELRAKEAQEKKQLQKQRISELRAAAASANGTTRKLGSKVRNRIVKEKHCPYCGDPLGLTPHADHIYPVCKGGRSVERNMIFVCSSCNAKKAHLTLAAFIKLFNLNREAIEARLTAMKKDF
ncbi:MAG: HNH endonuclease [Nitrospirae bacterium]|nr:HNH endonuclease [Nitrospirota bacterium]